MGNLHLVTGTKGQKHVTSADHASFHAAIFGEGQYVLNRGSKFATTTVTNNQIRVADGDILMQGRHIRLNEGTYVDLTIENGTQGMYRNDLIVARYTKDSASGVEDCNLVVIKGTPAASNPVDPAYTNADIINDHVLLADMPLYRVPLDGLNVQTLFPLFAEASLIADSAITSSKIAANAVGTSKLLNGCITRAKLANDALYSPVMGNASGDYNLTVADIGMTIRGSHNAAFNVVVTVEASTSIPFGAEFAVFRYSSETGGDVTVTFDGVNVCASGWDSYLTSPTIKIADSYSMIALKKVTTANMWLVTGNVEVVSE